jgi:hypothetical protein
MIIRLFAMVLIVLLAFGFSACGGGGYGGGGYGGGWGSGGGYNYNRPNYGGQVRSVTCESEKGRNKSCGAGMSIGRVELDKQLSDTRCVQGRTWGYDRNAIWVNQGCRARFRVYPGNGFGGGGNYGGGGNKVIRCESEKNRRRRCDAGFAVGRAVVERQLSDVRCDKGNSWGTDNRGVWVDRGCRADFRVYQR